MSSPPSTNQRQYHRIGTKIAIDFTVTRLQDEIIGIDWEKGFTNNISGGGIRLETIKVSKQVIAFLDKNDLFLECILHIPFQKPIRTVCEVMWAKCDDKKDNHYHLGLEFRSIGKQELKLLMNEVKWHKRLSKTAHLLLALFFSILIAGSLIIFMIQRY
jgi:hypothetical protein